MANSEAGLRNDVVQALGGEYQVFLNFRGSDTRHGFTDFLYHDLVNAGVLVFRDEDELKEGEVIGDNLLHAINKSILYIPIFSRNYASRKWPLRELALITDNVSKSEGQRSIFPIFLDVEPQDVKLKTSLYSDALLEHEKKFPDEVKDWRKALEEVDEIKGWNVKPDQGQAEIVDSIVDKVLEKLEIKQKLVTEDLVGLDDRVEQLIELLNVNHLDVRLIVIYGMGGIGKTTIAKLIFNRLSSHFGKRCSFLDQVRESSLTKEGIVKLQKKLLFDITGSRSAERVDDSEQGTRRIGQILRSKKFLVVLDDVHSEEIIKKLLGGYSLHPGSRILVTTRDKTIMPNEGFNGDMQWYEMLKMDDALALQLFCRHGFGKDFPPVVYRKLSSEIVSRLEGLPLAIKVLGSLLKGKNEAFWKETSARLKKEPEEEILKKLRISYDDLDKYQKEIFKDIAYSFFNEKKTDAVYFWDDCSFYPERGIHVLTSRCLIRTLDNDILSMHDLLIDLGRQIVREESQDNLTKQNRLWIAKEDLHIIETEERKHVIQGLEIREPFEITNEHLERLPNLRFLKSHKGTYAGDFARCHSNLRWFSWYSAPKKIFRAKNMHFDHLVVCKLEKIDFNSDSKAWDLFKRARNMKVLSLTQCRGIKTMPNISECSSLERLTFNDCSFIKRIGSFIGKLQSLKELKILSCRSLTYLPKEIGVLVKLTHFSLSGCGGLKNLPSSMGNLISLTELNLSDTGLRKLPDFIEKLKSLRILRFPLKSRVDVDSHEWLFPSGVSTLVSLEELDFSGHDKMKVIIPEGIKELSCIRILNLESTRISKIPMTINRLLHLQTLNLSNCHQIQELPELPISLTHLYVESQSLLSVPNLWNLTNLVELLLRNRTFYGGKSESLTECNLRGIGRLTKMKRLNLNLLNAPAPPELASLRNLEELEMRSLDLKPLVQLPSFDWSWKKLSTLWIGCREVEYIPLGGLPRLENLIVDHCLRLQRLSIPMELRKLRKVDVSGCPELVEIQVVGFSQLLILIVRACDSLTRISGLSHLKNLVDLTITKCIALTIVEGVNELESLEGLRVEICGSLRWLIDAACTKIPDGCSVNIKRCANSINSGCQMWLQQYRENVLRKISNKDGAEFDISGPDEYPDSTSVGASKTDGTSSIDEFQLELGYFECFEDTNLVLEKPVELNGEPSNEESAGDVTVSTIPSDSLAANRYSEASIASEVSRWSAEVDELERLLNANL